MLRRLLMFGQKICQLGAAMFSIYRLGVSGGRSAAWQFGGSACVFLPRSFLNRSSAAPQVQLVAAIDQLAAAARYVTLARALPVRVMFLSAETLALAAAAAFE